MFVAGIDPGQTGGIATLGQRLLTLPMPDQRQLIEFFRTRKPQIQHVFVEKAAARPKQGVVSMFNYGMGFGQILGILATLEIPHTLVHPATWTRAMHTGCATGKPKERSLEAAERLFPAHDWRGGPRSGKPHLGMIDAALIAAYGARCLGSTTAKS